MLAACFYSLEMKRIQVAYVQLLSLSAWRGLTHFRDIIPVSAVIYSVQFIVTAHYKCIYAAAAADDDDDDLQ